MKKPVICWCQHNQVYRRMIFENKGVVPVEEWTRYWNSGGKTSLERWQKLLADLGQKGDFSSILKCKMALKPLHVNIGQFLGAQNKPQDVILFSSERRLAAYTCVRGGKISMAEAKEEIEDFSALRIMLAKVKRHRK
ncbi:hypothetical protein B0T11DRAFT_341065 [Plectosphaerella cucumerina]|uniref:Uncharacterized protein n=1 Tax=Plectosphaerella cucumerina TaxID=40658 RepID=A0A8K0TET2_9PEZI|nr:hypothetical protein B0T11DRAFT_341065 [Plectosphaerella cucumerina]